MSAPLTLSAAMSERLRAQADRAGHETVESLLEVFLAAVEPPPGYGDPPHGSEEKIQTPYGPVSAAGIVPEEERPAFLAMLRDRCEGSAEPADVVFGRLREKYRRLEPNAVDPHPDRTASDHGGAPWRDADEAVLPAPAGIAP